jgi:hypothetical protein
LKIKLLFLAGALAQIEVESLANIKAIFSWQKNSDARSSFCCQRKKAFVEQAWNGKLDWLLKINKKNWIFL